MKYCDYVHMNCAVKGIPGEGFFGKGRAVIAEESRPLIKSLEGISVRSPLGVGKIESIDGETGNLLVRFDDDQTKFYDYNDHDLELLGGLPTKVFSQ